MRVRKDARRPRPVARSCLRSKSANSSRRLATRRSRSTSKTRRTTCRPFRKRSSSGAASATRRLVDGGQHGSGQEAARPFGGGLQRLQAGAGGGGGLRRQGVRDPAWGGSRETQPEGREGPA